MEHPRTSKNIIEFCQKYFRSEHRDPTITEIKMIDTYWTDHCRHTTFGTILDDVQIDDAIVQKEMCIRDRADKALDILHANGEPEAYRLGVIAEGEGVELC